MNNLETFLLVLGILQLCIQSVCVICCMIIYIMTKKLAHIFIIVAFAGMAFRRVTALFLGDGIYIEAIDRFFLPTAISLFLMIGLILLLRNEIRGQN